MQYRKLLAWMVHLLTASTAIIGIVTIAKIESQQYIQALWLMGAATLIDAIDGTLARSVNVKKHAAKIDGALLDNIVDFLNYVITPCYLFVSAPNMLFQHSEWVIVSIVILASCYQFTQCDAKTSDHFFKGFPCYWNIVVFYCYLFDTHAWFNSILLLVLSVLVFVPIKYVYPSRLDYLTPELWLKRTMQIASIFYGVSCYMLLVVYPKMPLWLLIYSASYIIFYLSFSIFRTTYPMLKKNINKRKGSR